MLCLGNERINQAIERVLKPGYEKPTPSSSRAERENWIKAKYQLREFTPPVSRHFKVTDVRSNSISLARSLARSTLS